MVRYCDYCNKPFETKHNQIYCSDECRKIGNRMKNNQRNKENRAAAKSNNTIKKRKPKRKSGIDKTIQEARAAGLSYGKFMAAKYMEERRLDNERNKNGAIS